MNYKELFTKLFIDNEKLSNKEILDIYETFDYKDRLYFTFVCQKNLNDPSFGSRYYFNFDSFTSYYQDMEYKKERNLGYKKFVDNFSLVGDFIDITNEQKEKILEMSSYPIENRGDEYWAYHGYNQHAAGKINRNFAIKIGVSTHSFEDSKKVYEVLMPYLIENEKDICFKMPFQSNIEKHLHREMEGNLLTIYTLSDEQAFKIMKDLNSLLKEANLNIEKGTNKAYVEVGDSGIVSAIIDSKPYSTEYISRVTDNYSVGRNLREDNFERLKGLLEKEGLVYGRSIEANDKKELDLKFGKYRNLRPKLTFEDIKKVDEERGKDKLAYILGFYNTSKDDLKNVFDKENGIVDGESFATLKSYGYDTFECLDILSTSKKDNLYSFGGFRSSLNLLDDIRNEEDRYFEFLNNLYNKDKESFTSFYNYITESLIFEEECNNKHNDLEEVSMNPFIKKHIDFILEKSENVDFPKNKFFHRITVDYLNDTNPSLNKVLFDKNIYRREMGQVEIDSFMFRRVRNDRDAKRIENKINLLKDIGFEISIPDTKEFLYRFETTSSSYTKENLIEDILEEDSYYAYLHKDDFESKSIENINCFIKELFNEKYEGKIESFDTNHIIEKYLDSNKEIESQNYKLFIEKAFDTDIVNLDSFKTKLDYKINRDYCDEEKLLFLYKLAKDKDLKIDIYNYNFEKVLEKNSLELD